MRTTIQLSDEQGEKLRKLAAERGQRGCTKVVQEAVLRFLAEQEAIAVPPVELSRRERIQDLLVSLGRESRAGVLGVVRALASRARRVPVPLFR